jgi:ABC-type nitrate/sulfonate/bicarbonate transport system substrate-binding protein
MIKKILMVILVFTILLTPLAGCGDVKKDANDKVTLKKVTLLLDWVPNTNHTGLYVARDNGYYAEEGLDVDIIQPSEGGSEDMVAVNKGEFGISYQEKITYARTADKPLPVKAIAAIIQHNTSGFASPVDRNIKTPKDFENKKYGGFGTPIEEKILKALMDNNGADYSKLKFINIGASDFFTSVQKDVDFSWIYYGWDGIAAGIKKIPIDFIKLQDLDPKLDFYTPVIIANDSLLQNDPELVKKFLKATAKGYKYSVDNPEAAADILLKADPSIDKNIAIESQKYLSKEYISDASRWGEMKESTWETFGTWMLDNGLINKKLNTNEAFTNEYLPK